MATVIKSVRVNEELLNLLQQHSEISKSIFHDKETISFSEYIDIALKFLIGRYGESLEELVREKEYTYRDKTGTIRTRAFTEEEIKQLERFANNALGIYYAWMEEEY